MDALKATSHQSQILVLAFATMIVNTGFGIIFPVFPKFLKVIGHGDASDLGKIAATFGLTYLIASPIFGNMADRVGKKTVIVIGLVGFIFSNLIYIKATNLVMLYLARAVEGVFAAAVFPPAMALVTILSPEDKKGKYIGIMAAGQTVGIIIGPTLGGVLLDGFTMPLLGLRVVGSLLLPFYTSMAIGVLSLIFSIIMITDPGKNEVKQSKERFNFGRSLRKQYNILPRPLMAFALFIMIEIAGISAWLVIEPGFVFYFYDELLLSATDFGLWVGVFGIISALGQGLLGNLSDRFGRKRIIFIGQILTTSFYLLLPYAKDFVTLSLVVMIVGVGSGLRDPALKAMLTDVSKPEHRATLFGIEAGLLSISQIVSPILGGFLYVTQGMNTVFLAGIAFTLFNIVAIPFLGFRNPDTEHLEYNNV